MVLESNIALVSRRTATAEEANVNHENKRKDKFHGKKEHHFAVVRISGVFSHRQCKGDNSKDESKGGGVGPIGAQIPEALQSEKQV